MTNRQNEIINKIKLIESNFKSADTEKKLNIKKELNYLINTFTRLSLNEIKGAK